ncbi:hypothetical protein QFC22_006074 [Naganishia vaughanmartiniae]|uniref:Uncharacterized protein n=1 Tax=Naganishia vaughanmartiniae TaxID=1424756 RepID=A0ACC2WPY1_9TREE|nr:hypothetical protein QFC22_006074 [Naganishia vaughanmartiniae]
MPDVCNNKEAEHKPFLAVLLQDALTPFSLEEADNGRAFLRLPHPRHNQPSLYLPYKPKATGAAGLETYRPVEQRIDGLLEVQKVEPEAKRSWFLEQSVVSDGSLMVMTPIDPLFLLIPLVVSLLSTRSRSTTRAQRGSKAPDTTFSTVLDLENDENASRTDRFLPLDDLISEASRMEVYKLEEPFTVVKKGRNGDTVEGSELDGLMKREEDEWTGNEDVVRLCELQSVRQRLRNVCETQKFPPSTEDEALPTTIDQDTFYRASPRLVLDLLRIKVDKLANAATLSSFPSLLKQILRGGVDEDMLYAYQAVLEGAEQVVDKVQLKKNAEAARKQKVADQARVKVACEIIGQYLSADVFQCLVKSYEYVQHFVLHPSNPPANYALVASFALLEEHLETQAAVAFASSHTVSGKTNAPGGTEPAAKPGVKRKGSGQGSRGVEVCPLVLRRFGETELTSDLCCVRG